MPWAPIRFHRALRHLTPLQARDPRIWTRLAHMEFWPYMRLRWPVEKHMSNRNSAARFVESRYFVEQSPSRALLRNGVARLWWTAQLSHDPDRDNPHELTTVLHSTKKGTFCFFGGTSRRQLFPSPSLPACFNSRLYLLLQLRRRVPLSGTHPKDRYPGRGKHPVHQRISRLASLSVV